MRFLSVLALALAATPAHADVTAIYGLSDTPDVLTIEADAQGDCRVDSGTLFPGSYTLMRSGQQYVVWPHAMRMIVMRQRDLAAVLAERLAADHVPLSAVAEPRGALPHLVARGTAVVGARSGTAYFVVGKGSPPSNDPVIVIGHDPDLAPLRAATETWADATMAVHGRTAAMFAAQRAMLRTGVPLRFWNFVLKTVRFDPIAPERFALPGPVATLAEVRAAVAELDHAFESRDAVPPSPAQAETARPGKGAGRP